MACRHSSHNKYILTRVDGAQYAIFIPGNGRGLNLEDLAFVGQMRYAPGALPTRLSLACLSVLCISLLANAAGVRTNTWFLLAIGGIGIVQNVVAVGWRRNQGALGVHLEFREVIGEMATMESLDSLETKYASVGKSLLPIFFRGNLLPEEVARWKSLEVKANEDLKLSVLKEKGDRLQTRQNHELHMP